MQRNDSGQDQSVSGDALCDRVFAGNPAAVCSLKEWLPDDVMQSMTAENNLRDRSLYSLWQRATNSGGSHPQLKWDLCGHADMRP